MTTINSTFKEFTLDNGLYVALQETPTQTIYGNLIVHYGAAHEQSGQEGLAHFLEHCVINSGTKAHSPKHIETIKAGFGYSNAFTGLEETLYIGEMIAADLEIFLSFLSGIAFTPRFDITKVNEEKRRVLREIADLKGNPEYYDIKFMTEQIHGKNNVRTREIMGNSDIIKSSTSSDLKSFHRKGYGASNMELLLVGALPKNTEYLVQKYFENQSSGKNYKITLPRKDSLEETIIYHSAAPDLINYENQSQSNAYINLSVYVPTRQHPDAFNLIILGRVLAHGPNSRIFKKISKEQGLAYKIDGGYDGFNNAGNIYVYGNVSAQKTEEAINHIFNEMLKLRETPVSSNELFLVRKQTEFELGKIFETNQGHVNAIRHKRIYNETPEDILTGYETVTPESLRETARKYLPECREESKYALLIRDPLKNN